MGKSKNKSSALNLLEGCQIEQIKIQGKSVEVLLVKFVFKCVINLLVLTCCHLNEDIAKVFGAQL